MKAKDIAIMIVGVTIGVIIGILINTLIWWGIGNLIVYAFGLSYSWGILQSLCVCLVQIMLRPDKFNIKLNTKSEKKEEDDNEKE